MNRNLFDEDDDSLLDISSEDRLDSWKEIASHLRRDVRTVQRWEKNEGLPVHRHRHLRGNSVFAFPDELDDWWSAQSSKLEISESEERKKADGKAAGNGTEAKTPGGNGTEAEAVSGNGTEAETPGGNGTEAKIVASSNTGEETEKEEEVKSNLSSGRGVLRAKSWIRTRLTAGISILIAAGVLIFLVLSAYKKLNGDNPAAGVSPLTFHPGHEVQPDISSDGRYIAYSWGETLVTPHRIFVEEIEGTGSWIRSSDSGSDYSPVWSEDDSQIYFLRKFADGTTSIIRTSPFVGGEEKISEVRAPPLEWGRQMDFNPNDQLLVVSHSDDEQRNQFTLFLFSPIDDGRTQLTYPPTGLVDHSPRFSPDGRFVAFIRSLYGGTGDLCILNLDVNYRPVGEVWIAKYDYGQIFNPTWSRDGRTVFVSAGYEANSRLWKIKENQYELVKEIRPGLGELAISPAGHVVSVQNNSDVNIWQRKIDPSGGESAIAKDINSSRNEWAPVYSPDGKRIAFLSDRSGEVKIWICDADGGNLIELASGLRSYTTILSWSPDGKWIAFDSHVGGNSDIYLICAETRYDHELCCQGTERCTRRLTDDPGEDLFPSWSLDNGSVLFASNRDGKFNIWKVPAAGGAAIRLTADGAIYGKESRDGDFIIYGNWPGNGISRLNLNNGSIELIVADALGYPFEQDIKGLYFLSPISQSLEGAYLNYREWDSGEVRRIFALDRSHYGFTVSGGMDAILFPRLDREESDLVNISGLNVR